ncbi:MAG: hypothetical protein NUV96_01680 [Candidatus Colwellbacteria bacterium]|nr:hypothetical protein [Candidatus Colwellbacteria bacterium]
MRKAEEFVPSGGWLHLDVSDGKFTTWKSWNNPGELKNLKTKLNIEVHLMVEDPQGVAMDWLTSGVGRLIVPVQVVKDMDALRELAKKYNAQLVPSFDESVPIENIKQYKWAEYVGVLAVSPGASGQKVIEESFGRVKFLREAMPNVKIEFDGGVDFDTGMRAIEAGADILASEHYIFESVDPKENFMKLNNLKQDVS